MMSSIEDEYLDVLQNIETAIVSVYSEQRELTDYDVDKALNILWTEYRNEKIAKVVPAPRFNENAQMVYDRVKHVCEWRLGRVGEKTDKWFKVKPEPITIDVVMDCLKRIRKSVDLWHKEGGRQGYLYFIENNIGS